MSELAEILQKNQEAILSDWIREQLSAVRRRDLISDTDLRTQSSSLLKAIAESARNGNMADPQTAEWGQVRELLTDISSSRAKQGFSPTETATFVFSLKQPVFSRLRTELGKQPDKLFEAIWSANLLIDKLGMFTTETFMKAREEVIVHQQEEMLELSTPVVKLWDGIVALPLIGTLDSNRTQVVMESLLTAIVATNSRVAIIDITGVPAVDTLVAQHLLKTITAARLMGADCIISGVRPQIAQTIVHLGINLTEVITKAKLSDAFALALQRTGRTVARIEHVKKNPTSNGFVNSGADLNIEKKGA